MPFISKKQKQEFDAQKIELEEQRRYLDLNLNYSNKIQEETKDTQKSNLEIIRQNYELNKSLTKLVAENKETENILLKREQNIKLSENEIDERKNNLRKEEVIIEARKSEVRTKEQRISEHERNVVEREKEAQKVKSESEQAKEKYNTLFDELEGQKENIDHLEEDAERKNNLATEKETAANNIFEKAKVIDEEIKAKEAEFEAKREEIESALNAKIEEYDRKLEDMNNVQEFIDNINFDDSEDGRAAKIEVKEAIRQAKQSLTDIKTRFDELDEYYCSGTFKGFSTPFIEIDKSFEELKNGYQEIKLHVEKYVADMPKSINKWSDAIETYIVNADKNLKSWEFSETYRNIIFGLSMCSNYILLCEIINEINASGQEKKFKDWYEILNVDPSATEEEIKKKYRALSKIYHDDKVDPNNDDQKEEFGKRMRDINAAWEILEDEEKRKKFDEKRKNHNG